MPDRIQRNKSMAKKPNKVITNTSVTRKEYTYEMSGCRLSFTLRTDNTNELVPYEHLMKQGLADIQADIKEIQSKRKRK